MDITYLTSWGGAGTVTGSLHVVGRDEKVMLDCGLFQGSEADSNQEFEFDVRGIAAVLLSHAHIDHSGRLPLLVRAGFKGRIFAQAATRDLCEIMLEDSANIQKDDGLYGAEDVREVMTLFERVDYEQRFMAGDVECEFLDAGHILGSAMIRLSDHEGRTLLYSGDVGRRDSPLLCDPRVPEPPDFLICEATYGGKRHEMKKDSDDTLRDVIRHVIDGHGNLIIPAFAVGRTQELIYKLDRIFRESEELRLPVVLDSPLGIKATTVTRRHAECYDDRAGSQLDRGDDPLDFPELEYAESADESRELNDESGMIIIAGSGMATGGRVQYHLQRHLGNEGSAVLLAGHQAKGTLGRDISEGKSHVEVLGNRIDVRARVESLSGLSAHADGPELCSWVKAVSGGRLKHIVLVHGEKDAVQALSDELQDIAKVTVAHRGEMIHLGK